MHQLSLQRACKRCKNLIGFFPKFDYVSEKIHFLLICADMLILLISQTPRNLFLVAVNVFNQYLPDYCLDHVSLHFGVHAPGGRNALMYDVIIPPSVIVPIAVALLTVSYRMVTIVASTLRREAY